MRLRELAAVLTVLSACPLPSAAAPSLSIEDLAQIGQRLATERCSKPISVSTEKIQNKFEPEVIDKIILIRCPGFDISTYVANSHKPPRELLNYAVLKAPDPRVPKEIGVGASRQAVLTHGPKPHASTPDSITYVMNVEGPGDDTLVIKLVNDRVRELVWSWHFE